MYSYLKDRKTLSTLGIVLALTFVAFFPCLKGEFLDNWDDDAHLVDYTLVRSLDWENIKKIFSDTINDVYLPLTTLSFALEYHFFEYNPFVYHLNNLILHLLITAFVFIIALQLGLDLRGAFLASLLFGIHPMRVESVAWVTERKDVLYGFFYVWAMHHYLRYLASGRVSQYVATLILGCLSLLAKPMALSLVLVLFLLDWFKGRKFSWALVIEKIPIVIYTVLIVWMTYRLHMRVPVADMRQAPLVWMWTYIFYLRKFVFPFVLIPVYALPNPISLSNPQYGISALTGFILGGFLVRFRKNRWIVFAFLFYFLSIFFLLRTDIQWDMNIVADRFMYLPSLGFCLLFGFYATKKLSFCPKKVFPRVDAVSIGVLILFLWFGTKSFLQTRIWENNRSLWNYVIEKIGEKDLAYIAFNNRALSYLKDDKLALALDDLNRSVRLNPEQYYLSYYNRGNVYMNHGFYELAIMDFTKAIAINSKADSAYNNRGLVYEAMGEYNKAMADFFACLSLGEDNVKCWANRSRLYKRFGKDYFAEKDLKRAIELGWKPENE